MFGLLAYTWASALVTGLLGALPGRSLQFRVSLVAIILTLGATFSYSLAHSVVEPLFNPYMLPEEFSPGELALLALYTTALAELAGFLVMVAAAYFLRHSLLPHELRDTRRRKLLILVGVVVVAVVAVIPLLLDGVVLRMFELYLMLL